MAPDSREASCSSQPARMITVNSLKFLLPLRWAAITLNLLFKPLIMILREWKEPRELNSHSRLKRIITPLGQFQTWAFNTPEDYYDVTMSISLCLLSTRPGALQKPWTCPQSRRNEMRVARKNSRIRLILGPPSCWQPARARGRGAAAILYLYYNMKYFVQSGH